MRTAQPAGRRQRRWHAQTIDLAVAVALPPAPRRQDSSAATRASAEEGPPGKPGPLREDQPLTAPTPLGDQVDPPPTRPGVALTETTALLRHDGGGTFMSATAFRGLDRPQYGPPRDSHVGAPEATPTARSSKLSRPPWASTSAADT